MATKIKTVARAKKSVQDPDAPLKEDIRLLGRLLGQVLREQERDIARLLAVRDNPLTPKELHNNTGLIHARIATLWQTRMLRYSKLTVADEIENALSYYRITFLHELPALYNDIEADIAAQFPTRGRRAGGEELASYLQMGSWIGGDRDGNPNVNAATMLHALTRQSTTNFDFYLDEAHAM